MRSKNPILSLLFASVLLAGCGTVPSSQSAAAPGQRMFDRGHALWVGNGKGFRDQPQAVRCFIASAEQGNTDAMMVLGDFCEFGRPPLVYPKASEAFEWYRRAAVAGDQRGMARLARAYAKGMGTQTKPDECFRWVEKLAQANVPMATVLLGEFYESGYGVAADKAKATSYYETALKSGDAEAVKRAEARLRPKEASLMSQEQFQTLLVVALGVALMDSILSGGDMTPSPESGASGGFDLGRTILEQNRRREEQTERQKAGEDLWTPSTLWEKGW